MVFNWAVKGLIFAACAATLVGCVVVGLGLTIAAGAAAAYAEALIEGTAGDSDIGQRMLVSAASNMLPFAAGRGTRIVAKWVSKSTRFNKHWRASIDPRRLGKQVTKAVDRAIMGLDFVEASAEMVTKRKDPFSAYIF
jgi:hypothetical protein